MKKANIRVEAKRLSPNASYYERDKEFGKLRKKFKRVCESFGLSQEIAKREFFVRECDKRRQKKSKKLLTIRRAQQEASLPPEQRNQKTNRRDDYYGNSEWNEY